MIKLCSKCLLEKDSNSFPKDSSKKDGLYPSCRDCKNAHYFIYSKKEGFKEKKNSRMKEYYKNPNVIERIKNYNNEYKIRINVIIKRNYINSERKKNDKLYYIRVTINKIIDKAFKRKGINKPLSNKEILGCEYDFFLNYIQSQFENWMDWNNRGLYNGSYNYGWDLDHIFPLRDCNNEIDMIKANHYTNFRPLCSKINRYEKK